MINKTIDDFDSLVDKILSYKPNRNKDTDLNLGIQLVLTESKRSDKEIKRIEKRLENDGVRKRKKFNL
uniref:Uncharacterized protein n=1 Tax=Candidatus Kentrum sp. FW TaxID=2126338 RepID=A0A450U4H9_9GAMM|nr:MAG: hypothetical protein BECKFW1821C_GA0114237_12002 [Candidatus Kentron sp. FW]